MVGQVKGIMQIRWTSVVYKIIMRVLQLWTEAILQGLSHQLLVAPLKIEPYFAKEYYLG